MKMKKLILPLCVSMVLLSPMLSTAGGNPVVAGPMLDETLMGMKEQGVWYFLCTAPAYPYRIPPHFMTFGPPPPPCVEPPGTICPNGNCR